MGEVPRQLNTPARRPASSWGERLLFAAVDLIVTFQLTGAFLFQDRTLSAVPLWRVGVFLLCAGALVFPLRGVARLLRRWDEKAVFRARPGGREKRKRLEWIIAAAVFLGVTALARGVLPELTAEGHGETSVTVTVVSGRVGVLASYDRDGAPAATEITEAAGDWAVGEDGNWWASRTGSALTVHVPACRDADLLLAFDAEGRAEIADGDLPLRRGLRSPDPEGEPRVYHVRSARIPGLSPGMLWLLSLACGAAYALTARELYTVTVCGVSHGRYRRGVFFALAGIWLLYLAAGNPGAMSADSLDQLSQALGLSPVTDAHPALLTFVWRGILRLTGSPAWISVCQILAYAAAVSAFLGWLSRRGLSRNWLTAFALAYGFHVVNGIYAAVLWKDVPYTIVLLWLTLLLVRMGEEGRAFFTPLRIGETGLCLALTLLLRHNGLVVLLFAGLALGILSLRGRTLRPLLALALGVGLILGIRGPGFRALGVEARAIYDPAEFLHGMAHVQIVTGEEDPVLTAMAPPEVWEKLYSPYIANDITMSPLALAYDIPGQAGELGAAGVLRAYGQAFLRHPFLVLRDRLYGCNLLWDPVPTGYNYRVCGDAYDHVVKPNALGYFCRENALTEAVYALYALTAHRLLLDVLVWRPAWCLGLTLLLFWMAVIEKKRGLRSGALPMGANALSLAAAMAWQDFRYVYFVFVCGAFLLLTYFVPPREERKPG
ncbi:MAG: hypothetical protein IJH47_07925 [Oscillospiraceae bacterium]|nr:hypothetical protein [Oscillospiraceae bacterium]